MSHKLPPYLKLHLGEDEELEKVEVPAFQAENDLIRRFEELTGWCLRLERDARSPKEGAGSGSRALRVGQLLIDDMSDSVGAGEHAVNRVKCENLLESLNQVLSELSETRVELWKREAELATSIPVISKDGDQRHLAERLEEVLRGGAQSVNAHAAALYVLDDATSQLKLRAGWEIPVDSFLEPARPLRGAMADLEALVGHAVVLEKTQELPHWQAPESFPSAVCVPVSSSTTPLGTMWVFSETQRDFAPQETELLEIVAGRLAAELEREAILSNQSGPKDLDRQIALASSWQTDRLPTIQPVIDDLSIAGWTRHSDHIGGDFHDWQVLTDGRLALSVGDAQGSAIEAALSAAALNASVRSHSNYRESPEQLLASVNETMWSGAMGDQFASLFYGMIDPSTWQFEWAIAGSVVAYIIREKEPILFEDDAPMLGVELDVPFRQQSFSLEAGDTVVILSDGMRHALWRSGVNAEPDGLGEFLQRHALGGCESLVALLTQIGERAELDGLTFDRAVLAAHRKK